MYPLPDAARHTKDPCYLNALLRSAGLTQTQACERLGISPRTFRNYLLPRSHPNHRDIPYGVQYGLEMLALDRELRSELLKWVRVARQRKGVWGWCTLPEKASAPIKTRRIMAGLQGEHASADEALSQSVEVLRKSRPDLVIDALQVIGAR